MSVALSLIIPAYNEAARLPPYLARVRPYLARAYGGSHEVIVVDDGSTDGTSAVVAEWARHWPELRLLRAGRNRGKGAAVRTGMLQAGGEALLFADADGATGIEHERALRAAVERGADVAVGSRLARADGVRRSRPWHRELCGRLFARATALALGLPVRDTQCGFKMFRRAAGLELARLCREPGFLFDVELLALAHWCRYRIEEVPVSWVDVPGSKVRLARDGWRMLLGIPGIRQRRHAFTARPREGAGAGSTPLLRQDVPAPPGPPHAPARAGRFGSRDAVRP